MFSSLVETKDKRAIFIPKVAFTPNRDGTLKYKIQTQKLPKIEKANQNIELAIYFPSEISLKKDRLGAKQTNAKIKNIKNPSINEAKNLFALKKSLPIE